MTPEQIDAIANREATHWQYHGVGPTSFGVLLTEKERDALIAEARALAAHLAGKLHIVELD